jgi:MFS transporter, SP family, xylose:H+ symportor
MSITAPSNVTRFAIIAACGGLLFGYDTAVISGTVSSLRSYFIDPLALSPNEANTLLGFIVSCALIGCVIGGAAAGWFSSRFGRRLSLKIAAVLLLISAIGSAWPEFPISAPGSLGADGLPFFIFYRILGGIGVGMASMLSPMYIAEIAPAARRGNLVSWNQFAIIFGMLVVYFVNWGIAKGGEGAWLDTVGWRWMFASEVIPATIFFGLLYFVPESPRYYVLNGRIEEAKRVLLQVYSASSVPSILQEIKESVQHSTVKVAVTSYGWKVLIVGILLSAFQQLIGINVVLYYAPEIFKSMGSETDASLLQTIWVGAVNLLFTVLAIRTVDHWGRKPLQITGALIMALAMFSLGFSLFTQVTGLWALFSMLTYIAGFAMSWGPVVWVLLSEIFPNSIRSKAMAIAVAVQWITNYLVSSTFPILNQHPLLVDLFHHGFSYWLYGFMALIAAWFMWKYVPETKGHSLEELEKIWARAA